MTTSDSAVVVDTSVFSLIFNRDTRATFYRELLDGRRVILSFQTVEELWFGAAKAKWGPRRKSEQERHIAEYEIVWTSPELALLSADLRAERERAGRRLNTADAWIAATAILLGCPVAAHDRDFGGIPTLELIQRPLL